MSEPFSLEFMALIVGAVCIGSGIGISLALKDRRAKERATMTLAATNSSLVSASVEAISDDETSESAQIISDDFDDKFPSGSAEHEIIEHQISPDPEPTPVRSITTFQADSSEAVETSHPSLQHAAENPQEASVSLHDNLKFNFQNETQQHENYQKESQDVMIPSGPTAASPSEKTETVTNSRRAKESSFPEQTTLPLALPTDSGALQNITQIPLPLGALGAHTVALPTSLSYGATSNTNSGPSAYCVKCKGKKQIRDPTNVTMKNGRPATSGFCCDCGSRVFRIGRFQTC